MPHLLLFLVVVIWCGNTVISKLVMNEVPATQLLLVRFSLGVLAFMTGEVTQGLRSRFEDLQQKRRVRSRDLASGRAYVASYVSFVHYVEGLHGAAASPAEGHYPEHDAPAEAH